jgi:superfamily I DNA/RNA helicase
MYLEPKPGKKIEIEDERRLFYVGVTRAKNKLYMSYSGATPRFIREMEL